MKISFRRSLLITLSQSYVALGLQFITSIIIARLLTPEELGVFSVAMVLVAIVNTLRDFGVVEYVVQEKALSETRLRAAGMLTFITAWGMAALVLLVSGPVAEFYRQPDVALLLNILSLNFFLLPFGSVISAHMRRQLDFTRIALIRTTVALVHAGVSIGLAYIGFGYFALAWSVAIASLTNVVLLQISRPKGFPFLPGFKEFRHVLSFGSFSSLSQVLKDMDKGGPDLVLGRLMGMESVAFFGRATGLIDLFNRLIMQAVDTVVLPLLSARARNNEDLTQPFLTSVTYLTGIAWPFYLFVGMTAEPLIRVLYGDQWDAAIPIVQLLCIGEALIVPFYLQHQVSVSQGLVRREVLRNGLIMAVRLLPLLLLPSYGLEAVVTGYACAYMFVAVISYFFLRTICDARLTNLWQSARPSLYMAVVTAIPLSISAYFMRYQPHEFWQTLATSWAALAVGWLIAGRSIGHPCYNELRHSLARLASSAHNRRKRHG